MKKILSILLLSVLFISCSSDDDNTDTNNDNGKKGLIDERILGKWKVEYSKTIRPAIYNEETNQPEYGENATIKEYDGDLASTIDSYMFDSSERVIEINKDNKISIYWIDTTGKLINANKDKKYSIKNNYITTGGGLSQGTAGIFLPTLYYKYKLENETLTLIIEWIKATDDNGNIWNPPLQEYTISRYSKITE